MRRALDEFIIEGVDTTIPFHQQLMEDERFRAGEAEDVRSAWLQYTVPGLVEASRDGEAAMPVDADDALAGGSR